MNEVLCDTCGRTVMVSGNVYEHYDKRIKHPVIIKIPDVPMPAAIDVPEEDESLMEAADQIFADMDPEVSETYEDELPPGFEPIPAFPDEELVAPVDERKEEAPEQNSEHPRATRPVGEEKPEVPGTGGEEKQGPVFGLPDRDSFVNVKGGAYLPARRRIMWLRGEPEQHPDWTIDTYAEEIDRGTYINASRVEGGYARYRANLFDGTGRLISTGTKTEWSERFMDFAEKAETGAIARALAVAGYGTEAALDLDEGLDQERIADAPVPARAINISSSAVPGLVQGGRSEAITKAQLNEIQRLVKVSSMGLTFVPFVQNLLKKEVPPLDQDDPTGTIMEFLASLSFIEAAGLITALNDVIKEKNA